jgi:hypothetical protein
MKEVKLISLPLELELILFFYLYCPEECSSSDAMPSPNIALKRFGSFHFLSLEASCCIKV